MSLYSSNRRKRQYHMDENAPPPQCEVQKEKKRKKTVRPFKRSQIKRGRIIDTDGSEVVVKDIDIQLDEMMKKPKLNPPTVRMDHVEAELIFLLLVEDTRQRLIALEIAKAQKPPVVRLDVISKLHSLLFEQQDKKEFQKNPDTEDASATSGSVSPGSHFRDEVEEEEAPRVHMSHFPNETQETPTETENSFRVSFSETSSNDSSLVGPEAFENLELNGQELYETDSAHKGMVSKETQSFETRETRCDSTSSSPDNNDNVQTKTNDELAVKLDACSINNFTEISGESSVEGCVVSASPLPEADVPAVEEQIQAQALPATEPRRSSRLRSLAEKIPESAKVSITSRSSNSSSSSVSSNVPRRGCRNRWKNGPKVEPKFKTVGGLVTPFLKLTNPEDDCAVIAGINLLYQIEGLAQQLWDMFKNAPICKEPSFGQLLAELYGKGTGNVTKIRDLIKSSFKVVGDDGNLELGLVVKAMIVMLPVEVKKSFTFMREEWTNCENCGESEPYSLPRQFLQMRVQEEPATFEDGFLASSFFWPAEICKKGCGNKIERQGESVTFLRTQRYLIVYQWEDGQTNMPFDMMKQTHFDFLGETWKLKAACVDHVQQQHYTTYLYTEEGIYDQDPNQNQNKPRKPEGIPHFNRSLILLFERSELKASGPHYRDKMITIVEENENELPQSSDNKPMPADCKCKWPHCRNKKAIRESESDDELVDTDTNEYEPYGV